MTSGEPPKSDDAWKDRVKAEDAARDAAGAEPQRVAEAPPADSTADRPQRPEIDASQLPPANVSTLVTMLSTQAMAALGMIPDPATGQPNRQLALARHFIDMLAVIEDKTKGNLSDEEHRLLESALHELRMAFVHLSK